VDSPQPTPAGGHDHAQVQLIRHLTQTIRGYLTAADGDLHHGDMMGAHRHLVSAQDALTYAVAYSGDPPANPGAVLALLP
jgi:hypothetical protein